MKNHFISSPADGALQTQQIFHSNSCSKIDCRPRAVDGDELATGIYCDGSFVRQTMVGVCAVDSELSIVVVFRALLG